MSGRPGGDAVLRQLVAAIRPSNRFAKLPDWELREADCARGRIANTHGGTPGMRASEGVPGIRQFSDDESYEDASETSQ
jgi:hypothetical protein